MKSILVPIDFSPNSTIALEYAFRLANYNRARIVVIHIDSNKLDEDAIEDMKEEIWVFCEETRSKLDVAEVYYEVKVVPGDDISALDNPDYLALIDLVIMGTRGASSLNSSLIGSNTVNLLDRIKKPMLVIPNEAKYEEVKHIMFCADYKATNFDFTLAPLKEFAIMVDANVILGHIKLHSGAPNPTHLKESRAEGEFFGTEVNHSYKLIHADNVFDGINDFIDNHEGIQMVAMVNRKHNFFDQLFRTNNTHKMAYHTNLPLLVLPE